MQTHPWCPPSPGNTIIGTLAKNQMNGFHTSPESCILMPSQQTLIHILPGQHLDYCIRETQEAMQQDPLSTILILPTSRLVRDVRRRLLHDGISFIESAVTTLTGFAESLTDAHAGEETRITDHEKELVINALLKKGEYPLLAPDGYAAPGIAGQLRILFDVLAARKVDYPSALGKKQSRKSSEIGSLYAAYTRHLAEELLLDKEATLARATACIGAHGGPRTVFIYGLYEPFRLEKDLILALMKSSDCFTYALPYQPDSQCFADDGSWLGIESVHTVSSEEVPPRARFFDSTTRDFGDLEVRITRYRDPVDEIRGIAGDIRSLIDQGSPPGDITVVFPAIADAILLTDEVFREYGIPYATSTGPPITRTPVIRLLLQVLITPIQGFRRQDIVALLRSPYFWYSWNQSDVDGGDAYRFETSGHLDGGAVDMLSRKAGVTFGAADWRNRIMHHIRQKERECAALPEERAARRRREIREIQGLLDGIESLIKDLNGLLGERTLSDHIRAYRILLQNLTLPADPGAADEEITAEEDRALHAFTRLLDRLEQSACIIPEQKISASAFLSLLTQQAAATRLPAEHNDNAVTVIGIREAGYLAIPHLFIAGLNEDAMPRLTTRLPLCTNLETRELGTRTGPEILCEERYYFLAALLTANKSISLSYPETDGEKVLLRSGFLNGLSEDEKNTTQVKYSRRARAEAAGRLLRSHDLTGAHTTLPPDLDLRSVAERISIEEYHRHGIPKSPYDGIIGGDEAIVSILSSRFGDGAVYSASALERYARCPFSFFAGNVLGIEPLPEIELDLTSLERGNLIHRIAYRFFKERKKRDEPPLTGETVQSAVDEIRSICCEELDTYARTNPVWIVESEKLLGSDHIRTGILEEFLRYEMVLAASPFIPAHFEYSFGLPLTGDDDDPASGADPVQIGLADGSSILLWGRIDRIDITDDDRFCIIDYKTGQSPGYRDIVEGRALQLPLYIRAVELAMGLTGAGGAYYTIQSGNVRCQVVIRDNALDTYFTPFSRSRGGGDRALEDVISETLAWVTQYLDGIKNGRFPTVLDPGNCSNYCPYGAICRFDQQRLFEGANP